MTSLLSGGIDSSLVTSYACQFTDIKPFTMSFSSDSYNEFHLAKVQSKFLGLDLNEVPFRSQDLNTLERKFLDLDQPLANASYLASYELFEAVSNHGFKVCLTGDGADEIFGGYPTYSASSVLRCMSLLPHSVKQLIKAFFTGCLLATREYLLTINLSN